MYVFCFWTFETFVENSNLVYFNSYLARYVIECRPHTTVVDYYYCSAVLMHEKSWEESQIWLCPSLDWKPTSSRKWMRERCVNGFRRPSLFDAMDVNQTHKQPMSITLQTTIERRADDLGKKLEANWYDDARVDSWWRGLQECFDSVTVAWSKWKSFASVAAECNPVWVLLMRAPLDFFRDSGWKIMQLRGWAEESETFQVPIRGHAKMVHGFHDIYALLASRLEWK